MFKRLSATVILLTALWCAPAFAQNMKSYTVNGCGTPPNGFNPSGANGYSVGGWYPSLIDANTGNVCVTAVFSGTLSATITNLPNPADTNAGAAGTSTLRVVVATGGATQTITGSVSNASDAVATTSTNVPTVSYTYGWNGTTWDRLQVDGSKNLKVNDNQTFSPANVSATVTTGGTFQNACALNISRVQCRVSNPTSATEPLLVFDGTGTAGTGASIYLGPGAVYFAAGNGTTDTNAIQVTATTTGHAFSISGS